MYRQGVEMVTWDEKKARKNKDKHSVEFQDAAIALEDEYALSAPDNDHNEPRWNALCEDPYGRILFVSYTYIAEDEIKIISARMADKKQKRAYNNRRFRNEY